MNITLIGPTYPYKGGISHFTTILAKTLRKNNDVLFLSWKRQYPAFLYPVELKDTSSKNPVKVAVEYLLDFYNPFSWIRAFSAIKKQWTRNIFSRRCMPKKLLFIKARHNTII